MKALAIRNNNPLNIRFSPMNHWKGQIGCNRGFCTFDTMEHGYRAALVLLSNYVKCGYGSIIQIINRWAPASENNTKNYLSAVMSHFSGYDDALFHSLTAYHELSDFSVEDRNAILTELAWIMSLYETGLLSRVIKSKEWDSEVEGLYRSLMDAAGSYFDKIIFR